MCVCKLRGVLGLVDESKIPVFSGGVSLGGGESSQGIPERVILVFIYIHLIVSRIGVKLKQDFLTLYSGW